MISSYLAHLEMSKFWHITPLGMVPHRGKTVGVNGWGVARRRVRLWFGFGVSLVKGNS